MSIGKDGLHQLLLLRAQGHAWEMFRVEPDVCCYLQRSIALVIVCKPGKACNDM